MTAVAMIRPMATIDTRKIAKQVEDIASDLDEVIDLLDAVDGKTISDTAASLKIKSAAEISRDLLYLNHLLEKARTNIEVARIEVMDQYHDNRRDRNR